MKSSEHRNRYSRCGTRRYLATTAMLIFALLMVALPKTARAASRNWPLAVSQPHEVLAFQHLLRAWGHKLTPTGKPDAADQFHLEPQTRKMFADFAQARKVELPYDGGIPDEAWEALCSVKLSAGSRNPAVVALQTLLRQKGYGVPTDGVFTPRLKLVVMSVQKHAGLSGFMDSAFGRSYMGPLGAVAVTGIVDADTWAELFAQSRWPSGASNVAGVDSLLGVNGFPPRSGRYRDSNVALQAFQRQHQLVADGVLRDATWEAMVYEMKPGARGPLVKAYQEFCNAWSKPEERRRATSGPLKSAVTWKSWYGIIDSFIAAEAGSVGS